MKKIFYIASSALLLSSCMSDVLDKKPVGRELAATFFQNETNAISATTALYDAIQREEGYIRGFTNIGESRAELTKVAGSSSSDQLPGQQIAKYAQLSDNPFLIGIYKWSYVGIQRCNTILENIPYTYVYYPTNPIENKKTIAKFRGQAYFMRAFYYADLVRIFGPVQLVEKSVSADNLALGNRTADDDADGNKQVQAIYKLILSDLDSAVALLPTRKEWGVNNLGRANKGAAQAFLARAYMYVASNDKIFTGDKTQYWQKAADAADAILASGEYSLLPDFHQVFSSTNENNAESIFEVQSVNGADADFRAEGNIRALDQTYRFLQYKGTAVGGVLGYGLNSPTLPFVKMFDVENVDGSKGYTIDLLNQKAVAKKDWDPRLDLIAKPEDSIWSTDKWCKFRYDNWKWGIGEPFYNRKTELQWDELTQGKGGQSSFRNWIYYRLGELVLYRAEAALKLGDEATALKMINMVRARARKSKAKTIEVVGKHGIVTQTMEGQYPADLTSIKMDDIIKERALELGTEGSRFFDLVRTGYASTLLASTEIKESVSATVNSSTSYTRRYTERDALMPLPVAVIIEGQGLIKQNKGY